MKKVAVGCVALLVLLVVLPLALLLRHNKHIHGEMETMRAQFKVGGPVIPFSLAKSTSILAPFEQFVFFEREDKPDDTCLVASVRDDDVEVSKTIRGRKEMVKVDDFPKKLESLRESIAPCDKLVVMFLALRLPPRWFFVVHYDPSGNVTRLEAPRFYD